MGSKKAPPSPTTDSPRNYNISVDLLRGTVQLDELKKQAKDGATKQRLMVLEEIMLTEAKYVENLHIIVQVFLQPLREQRIIKEEKIEQMFLNIEQLCVLHHEILQKLNDNFKDPEEEKSAIEISKIVGTAYSSSAKPLVVGYGKYCTEHNKAAGVVLTCREKYPEFGAFLDNIQMNVEEAKGLRLADYLIAPVQRICKYPLLFRELLKVTEKAQFASGDDTESGVEELKDALATVKKVTNFINKNKEEEENQAQLRNIAASLEGYTLKERLVTPGRYLKKEGFLLKYNKVMKVQERYFFLFNDLLLYTRAKGKRYIYRGHISVLSSVVGREIILHSKSKHNINFGFQITQLDTKRVFYLAAHSQKDKDDWLRSLEEIIHAFREKEVLMVKSMDEERRKIKEQENEERNRRMELVKKFSEKSLLNRQDDETKQQIKKDELGGWESILKEKEGAVPRHSPTSEKKTPRKQARSPRTLSVKAKSSPKPGRSLVRRKSCSWKPKSKGIKRDGDLKSPKKKPEGSIADNGPISPKKSRNLTAPIISLSDGKVPTRPLASSSSGSLPKVNPPELQGWENILAENNLKS